VLAVNPEMVLLPVDEALTPIQVLLVLLLYRQSNQLPAAEDRRLAEELVIDAVVFSPALGGEQVSVG